MEPVTSPGTSAFFAALANPTPSEEGKETAINPANSAEQKLEAAAAQRTRIPMSIPRTKMSTPDIPGFHCHWINDYTGRIMQAQQAGYSFVSQKEAVLVSPDIAGTQLGAGTDLGSRVSIVVGGAEDGSPLRAYLMKLPLEFYNADQSKMNKHVDDIHDAMRQGNQQVQGDMSNRYVKSVSMTSTYNRSAKHG